MEVIVAIDQGTTGTTVMAFDREGQVRGRGYRELPQIYPRPGWVSHDPEAIWLSCLGAAQDALSMADARAADVAAIGITNQRETTVIWDRATGRPIAPAIVWQCRRTAARCDALRQREGGRFTDLVRRRTGLVIDPYFSGTKVAWILDEIPGARARAQRGELCFGTVDSWLLWRLTAGNAHVTDRTNASRTMLLDIHRGQWDAELLDAIDVPATVLPRVAPSIGIAARVDGSSAGASLLGAGTPIAGIAGDQQAALFGQTCFRPGDVKCTYGTGAFLLAYTGERAVTSAGGLLTTIAASGATEIEYALEGAVFIAGAAIQWLRDELRIIGAASEVEAIAGAIEDTGGVYLVPAFVGLGAPHWDERARGVLVGLTRGTGRAQIVRAALESMAYQVHDVVSLMTAESDTTLDVLRVDGGAAVNNLLCQFQADLLGRPVVRPSITETTALGAAFLAGLGVGIWESRQDLTRQWAVDRCFDPAMPQERRVHLLRGWNRAVERAQGWVE
ncbi:MAG: glycerol kinase GlpK [Chloroflexi bacterium]|nr:glycerol kinase GlpK [Chloroflexota bacterium]